MKTFKLVTINTIALLVLCFFASCEKENVAPDSGLQFQLIANASGNISVYNSDGNNFEDTLQLGWVSPVNFTLQISAPAGIQQIKWNLPTHKLSSVEFESDLPFATLTQSGFERKIFIHEAGDETFNFSTCEWNTRGANCSGWSDDQFEIHVTDLTGKEISMIIPIQMTGTCL